jgi:tetratricopeptide (TPR) repeat protein
VVGLPPVRLIRVPALAAVLLVAVTSRAAEPAPSPAVAPVPVVPLPSGAAPEAPPAAGTADTAASQPEIDMQASRALGHRLVRLGRYEEAIAAFRRAYELRADARLLYDIAECYRQVGTADQALFYYDRYLTDWPDAFDRDQVEKKVAALSAGRAREMGAVPRKRPLMVIDEANKPRPPARPWHRWWFWTAIGVSLAAGVTAAALSSRPDNGVPSSDLGSKRFF